MAPLPDNDKTPDKSRQDKDKEQPKDPQKDEKAVTNLNDGELKALLEEAINYKNPKDREGKSELFNDLLLKAEETERIARATSASGPERVRHCNAVARRQRHTGGSRGRRYGGTASSGVMGRSISERGTHGGSLDNLAKEELFEATCRRLRGLRKSSTSSSGASSSYGCNQVRVSARQREGGSLPSDVNSGESSREFLEEAKRNKELKDKEYVVVDMEKERFDAELLPRGYEERLIDGGGPSRSGSSAPGETHLSSTAITPKYTSQATLQIHQPNRASNVDDSIQFGGGQLLDADAATSDKRVDYEALSEIMRHSKCQVIMSTPSGAKPSSIDEKFFYFQKVDENGNALHQTKEKKKKKQTDKNVVVFNAESIAGHKSEIINNVEELLQFIEGPKENNIKSRTAQSKSKQLHKQHASEDGGAKPKKRHPKAGGKDMGGGEPGGGRHELKKSNSLGEISGLKLDREFEGFGKNKQSKEEETVVLRTNKPAMDRARERRSWGNVEQHSFLYNTTSMENLETATDNWEVTRPKKKSKKRRNSVSSASGARQTSSASGMSSSVSNEDRRHRRAPTPDLGMTSSAKMTRSMPHSEKSNDSSSDVDSVHSLPMDGPISYADIARNSEKKKPSPEKQDRSPQSGKEKSPQPSARPPLPETEIRSPAIPVSTPPQPAEKPPVVAPVVTAPTAVSNNPANKTSVPDVNNIKSFPAITGVATKTSPTATVSLQTSDKAVQSTFSYEEAFVREKAPLRPVVSAPGGSVDAGCREKRTKAETSDSVQGFFQADQGSNELSLMRNPVHYAAQRMPPDIVDVSTIEKLQLMNCSGSSASSTGPIPNAASTPSTELSPQQSGTKSKRKKPNINGGFTPKGARSFSGDGVASSVCDTTNFEEEEQVVTDHKAVNGLPENQYEGDVSLESDSPPPVVILSGTASKEVPSGLVFGFDINEQLLLEDSSCQMCDDVAVNENDITQTSIARLAGRSVDDWVKRYKPPPNDRGPPKHNHDKIVSFIATAWESVLGQQVPYYSDSL